MRIDVLKAELERLDREGRVPKFIYTVPSFQNPAGVTLSLERRRELVKLARERELLVLEDNPYGLLRYEGEPLPTLYSLDRGEYVIYLGTFSKILSPGLRLGWTAAPRPVLEKLNLGKGGVDLCSSTLSQQFVATYFAERDWRAYLRTLVELYRRRRDVMLEALAEHLPREATWTQPGGGLFIWARLPDYIDTTDLLARALRENVAFVPGRAAYLDGRGGSEMRLNFSGVGDDDIREGVRRIGKVVREQVDLYSTLTGDEAGTGATGGERGRAAEAGGMRVAVLKGGRSLERNVSLRSGARVEDALQRLGHEVVPIDVGADLVDRLGEVRPDVAFVALHGRGGEDGTVQELLELVGVPYTASGPSACIRCMDKVVAKHELRGGRAPDARLLRVQPGRLRGARRGAGAAGARGAARLPDRGQARRPGLGARDQVRAHGGGRAGRDRGRLLLRHQGDARALRGGPRPRGLGARRRGAAGRRGRPARGGLLRLRGALRDRPHGLHLPGADRRRAHGARAGAGARRLPHARLRGLRAGRPDARPARASCRCWRPTRSPGSPTPRCCRWPPRRPGIPFDDLIARIVDLAVARTPA